MKHIFYILLAVTMVLFNCINTEAQIVYNKDWVDAKGLPDSIDWGASVFTSYGQLAITGNTVVGMNNTDIITILYDEAGNTIWQQNFDGGSNTKDYGVAVTSDNSGNIYVAGVVTNQNGFFDMVALKYDNGGSLQWSTVWNGNDNFHDIPSCITVDNSGNVFVAGATQSTFSQTNFAALKLDPNGGLAWAATYDYANLYDFATSITILANGNVAVAGGSAATASSWDFATVEYDESNGSQANVSRINATGIGLDKALAITKDNAGGIYITGYADSSGNKNIQTVKLNPSFGVQWVRNFDGEGLEDVAQTIGVDINNNIIVAGYTRKLNGGTDFITIKYDSSGNELWQQRYKAPNETYKAEAKKLSLDNEGNIYLTGKADRNGSTDYVTIKYDPNGKLAWEKFYDGDGNGDDEPLDIQLDMQGNIFITGLAQDTALAKRYTTIKYSYFAVPQTAVNDTAGNPHHLAEQIIVKFNPDLVNTAFVNNKDKQFAAINQVIPDSIIIMMNEKIGFSLTGKYNVKLVKIFKWMTTADSVSITRLGDTIQLEKFWSAFILVLPNFVNLQSTVDSLNTLYPAIEYAHLNRLGKLDNIPNDSYIASGDEGALVPTATYPNANINIDPAWDIETGQSNIKVGVFDDVIYWAHSEFGDGTFAGSKIAGGWDYHNNVTVNNVTNPPSSHATSCAGIIGALRNNGSGIAGIAGGDAAQGNTGATLYSFGILNNGTWISTSDACSAIVQGSASTGYGLNIQSHSWGIWDNAPVPGGTIDQTDLALLKAAVTSCWRNNCALVASRGNDGNTDAKYPACYYDNMVINVGASGTDGEYKDGANNGDWWWSSSFAKEVDIIAPGTTEILTAPINPSAPINWSNGCTRGSSNYSCFNGTSAACPHVAGVAALMLSKHNTINGYPNNLAPEDVEFLLQKYATDKTTWGVGYDDYTGWGLLNAGATMSVINAPKYKVFHPSPYVVINANYNSGVIILLTENINGLAAGYYIADQYQHVESFSNTFTTTTQTLDHWARYASTNGYSQSNVIDGIPHADITSFTSSNGVVTAECRTYCWHVTHVYPTNQSVNVWIPSQQSNLRTALSYHLYDPNAVGIDEVSETADIKVFPNPASNTLNISYLLQHHNGKTKIEICDAIGQVVYSENLGSEDYKTITINTANFASGIYILKLTTDQKQYVRKIVKQ